MTIVAFETKLSPSACVKRLRERVGTPMFGKAQFYGKVRETTFWIEERTGYRNSFKTRVRGEISSAPTGARVTCRVGVHPLIIAFISVWASAVAIALAVVAVSNPRIIHVPLFMLCAGAGLFGAGRWLARGEEERLISFLASLFEANGQIL